MLARWDGVFIRTRINTFVGWKLREDCFSSTRGPLSGFHCRTHLPPYTRVLDHRGLFFISAAASAQLSIWV